MLFAGKFDLDVRNYTIRANEGDEPVALILMVSNLGTCYFGGRQLLRLTYSHS